jgi:stage II sporulation protein D
MRNKIWAAIFFCLLCQEAIAEKISRISILSVLRPTQITVTVRNPGPSVLQVEGANDRKTSPLSDGAVVHMKAHENGLLVNDSTFPAISVALRCKNGCRLIVEVPGKMHRLYHGDLELNTFNNTINIVLLLDTEELTSSILASETGEFREPEALRAFAILARSFLNSGPLHAERNADVCDSTHCQVFQGFLPSKAISRAVQSTHGLLLTYHKKPFQPFYSRKCGGRTSTFEDVWHHPAANYPFFSADCPVCRTTFRDHWRSDLSMDSLQTAIGIPFDQIQKSGGWIEIRSKGEVSKYSVENFRILLGREIGWKTLPGNSFDMKPNPESVVFEGSSYGHGVGLCQTGTEGLAQLGKSYQEILNHYFPNTEVRN